MQNITTKDAEVKAEAGPEGSFLPFGTAVEYVGNLLAEIRAAKVDGRATLTFTNSEIQSIAQANHSLRAARRSLAAHGDLVAALRKLDAACQSLGHAALPVWNYNPPAHIKAEWEDLACALVEAGAALARAEGK